MRALSAVKVPLDQRKRTDNLQVGRECVCVCERGTAKEFKWMFDCASVCVCVCVMEDFNHSEAQWEFI